MRWTDEYLRELVKRKEENENASDIARALQKISGEHCSVSSVNSRYSVLRHKEHELYQKLLSTVQESQYQDPLAQRLAQFERQQLLPFLEERNQIIKGELRRQAEALRNIDTYERFRGMSFEDLQKLEDNVRQEAITLLSNGKSVQDVQHLDLILTTEDEGRMDDIAVTLPLFVLDGRVVERGVRFALNASVVHAVRKAGYGGQATREGELTKYRFTGGSLDPGDFATQVTSALHRVYKPMQGVHVHIESPNVIRLHGK